MLIFAVEAFSKVRPEIEILMVEHWNEVASLAKQAPLDPAWEVYEKVDEAGLLRVITAREGGELAGYVVMMLSPALHYKSVLTANDTAHFLKKSHRKGLAGARLLKAAENSMREEGVHMLRFHTKARPDINKSRLFEALGFKLQELIYLKHLDEEN